MILAVDLGYTTRLVAEVWNGNATTKPRQVSVLLHPLLVGSAPLRLRGIGAAENTDEPVCSSYDTNALR